MRSTQTRWSQSSSQSSTRAILAWYSLCQAGKTTFKSCNWSPLDSKTMKGVASAAQSRGGSSLRAKLSTIQPTGLLRSKLETNLLIRMKSIYSQKTRVAQSWSKAEQRLTRCEDKQAALWLRKRACMPAMRTTGTSIMNRQSVKSSTAPLASVVDINRRKLIKVSSLTHPRWMRAPSSYTRTWWQIFSKQPVSRATSCSRSNQMSQQTKAMKIAERRWTSRSLRLAISP